MPRFKRRAMIRRESAYTDAHVDQLRTGHDFTGHGFGHRHRGECDDAAMREAWSELRDDILADWIAERPGSRPWAWWAFDATEPRRRIDGKPHPFDNRARERLVDQHRTPDDDRRRLTGAYRLALGVPSVSIVADDGEAGYETEAEYLDRLGLLIGGEREAMACG